MADFREYTKLRDIVVKRNKRAYAAGLAPLVHFPTVKEIKAGLVSRSEAMNALKAFHAGGSQVRAIRQTGLVPEFKQYRELPKERKLSEEERKQRKREQNRLYRQRQRIRKEAGAEKSKKYESYLKALDSVSRAWKRKGFNLGIDLQSLSPSQAQAFVEYMDYRFAQGDFLQRYVIDEFIQDFSSLLKSGYNPKSITKDFNEFLENRKQLGARSASMEGVTPDYIQGVWYDFIESRT